MKKGILIILLLLLAANAGAYNITWSKTNGPFGGLVDILAIPSQEANANLIFGGAQFTGIFRSVDSAASWENVARSFYPYTIVVDPADPSKIYAGTGGSVECSLDEGVTWGNIPGVTNSSYAGNKGVSALAVDPKKPWKIYAEGGLISGNISLYSIDTSHNPCTWELVATFEGRNDITRLAVSPDNSYIFAGVIGVGSPESLYRSTDEGVSWTAIMLGQPVTRIIPFPSLIYLLFGNQLYTSTNEGNSWAQVSVSPYSSVRRLPWSGGSDGVIGIKPNDPKVIYATLDYYVRVSFDGGATWTSAYNGLPEYSAYSVMAIAVSPASKYIAYVSTWGDGIYKTIDGGQHWNRANEGFVDLNVFDIAVDPYHNVFAGTKATFYNPAAGLWRSTDRGGSWQKLTNGLLSAAELGNVEVDVSHSGHVYAGGLGTGMFKSTDGGNYWVAVNEGLVNNNVTAIAVDYNYPTAGITRVYVGTRGDGVFWGSATNDPVNPGVSRWYHLPSTNLGNSNVLCLALFTAEGHYIYAGTEGGEVFRYNLSGLTWESLDLGSGIPPAYNVQALAVSPADKKVIFAGTDTSPGTGGRLYVTTTEGVSWSNKLSKLVSSFFVDSRSTPYNIYAAADNGIYRSTDEGSSWQIDANYLTGGAGFPVLSITRDDSDLTFYASGQYRGVAKGIPDIAVPATPSNLRGSAESSSSIRWVWYNVAGELGFRLKDTSNLTKATLGEDVLSYLESGLVPNTSYTRKVAAFGTVESTASSPSSEYTLANPPANLRVTGITGTFETLNWDTNSNPVGTKYVVELSTLESVPFGYYASFEADPPQNVMGLLPNSDYWFRVYAINHDGVTTEMSNAASAKTTHETQGPRIDNIRFDGIALLENDIIRTMPLITAHITDETTFPDISHAVSGESVALIFGDDSGHQFYVIKGVNLDVFEPDPSGGYRISHRLTTPLGSGTYLFTITASDELGNLGASIPRHVRVMSGSVQVVGPTIAYPTPFKPLDKTTGKLKISYTLSKDASVTIYTYDVGGRIVLTKKFPSGSNGGRTGYNDFEWDGVMDFGGTVGNGIYVYKIISGGKAIGTGKIVVYD